MNIIFPVLFLLCTIYFLLFQPQNFLPTLLGGAQKAATLSLSLLTVYTVWLGTLQLLEESKLTPKIAKLFRPIVKRLFQTDDEEGTRYLCMNLTANMLGISGAATPFGIKAASRLEQAQTAKSAQFAHSMLLVVNATSLQLLPTTALSLLLAHGAQNAYSVVLPSLLATAFSTALGIALTFLFIPRK